MSKPHLVVLLILMHLGPAVTSDRWLTMADQLPPGLPISYWDSPTGCATCTSDSGTFRDGLPVIDGESVLLMMDCDGDGTREQNVNSSVLAAVLNGGAYYIEVQPATEGSCGYDPLSSTRSGGDARFGLSIAFPRSLPFTSPGSSIQQRLEAHSASLVVPNPVAILWTPGIPEADPILGGGYDVIRGLLPAAVRDLAEIDVTAVSCNLPDTSVVGTPELQETPAVGQAYFFLVRPRSATRAGHYGPASGLNPRSNPRSGDCPL